MNSVTATLEDFDDIGRSVDAVAPEVLRELGAMTVNHLVDLDMHPDAAGHAHPELAELWYATDPTDSGSEWSTEILSRAEEMTFYTPTTTIDGDRVKTNKYPISGRQLLMILEGGAKAHFIFPKNAKMLVFNEPGLAARTKQFHDRYGFHHLSASKSSDTVMTQEVLHPGVQANEHIAETTQWLESIIDAWGEEAAGRIAVSAV